MRDYVLATLATVPERSKVLRTTLESLLPQVDEVAVYLNGYDEVPAVVRELGVSYALGGPGPRIAPGTPTGHGFGDRGDGGKFFWAGDYPAGWRLTCDDDFRYAPTYVAQQIAAATRLDAPVSLHGVVLSERLAAGEDVDWLKEGRARWLRACDAVEEDVQVHILGTGVACYHTSMLPLMETDFPEPHSADIWFSRACQEHGVPRYVWAHPADLAEVTTPPLLAGPKQLRRNGEYARRVASCAPWHLEER